MGSELLRMGGRSGDSADQNGNGGKPTLMSARFSASVETEGPEGADEDTEALETEDDDREKDDEEYETTAGAADDAGAAGRPLPSSTGNCVGVPQ